MNETVQNILNRRSIRAFKPDMPDAALLDTLLQCALSAPSGMNTQTWHFTLVKNAQIIADFNRDTRVLLPEAAKERMTARNHGNPDFSLFYFAPALILVSTLEGDTGSAINGALATENICIAAESLGLGTCIVGMACMIFDSPKGEDYRKILQIPDGYRLLHAVAIGYKDIEPAVPERLSGKVTVIE